MAKPDPNGRVGLVFVDFGMEPRQTAHCYDRQNSSASTIGPADFDWNAIASQTRLVYTDGVFAGLGPNCRDAVFALLEAARRQGATSCFDMNYREMIWTAEQARTVYEQALPLVDVLVTNRGVSEQVLGLSGSDEDLLRSYREEFGCRTVCLTTRHMESSRRGSWNSQVLWDGELIKGTARCFEVIDRFGTGDAFFAGFLHGFLDGNPRLAVDFGNALCALAHTIQGDVADVSLDEVQALLRNGYDSRLKR
jgi:2-dehydro-3-deoxygluconokinase